MTQNYLSHHGIKGMKWGVRRYQNEDGTLTEAGKKRYRKDLLNLERSVRSAQVRSEVKKNKVNAADYQKIEKLYKDPNFGNQSIPYEKSIDRRINNLEDRVYRRNEKINQQYNRRVEKAGKKFVNDYFKNIGNSYSLNALQANHEWSNVAVEQALFNYVDQGIADLLYDEQNGYYVKKRTK